MNKYIKAVFCVPLAGIKYAILKIENGGRFHAAFPAIMSPMTEVTVDGKSELRIAKKLKMHNGAKIRVRKGGKLEIGKNFGMSNGCVVTAYDHIKIGANALILRGTTIGDNTVVGGGTVVKGDFPANSVIIQKRTTEVRQQHNGINQSIT